MVYHISDENSLQSSNHAPTSQCRNASLLCPAVSHMSPHHHRRWSASLALAAKSPDPFCYRWSLREMHRLGGSNHLQIINPGRFCPCFSRFFFNVVFPWLFPGFIQRSMSFHDLFAQAEWLVRLRLVRSEDHIYLHRSGWFFPDDQPVEFQSGPRKNSSEKKNIYFHS